MPTDDSNIRIEKSHENRSSHKESNLGPLDICEIYVCNYIQYVVYNYMFIMF